MDIKVSQIPQAAPVNETTQQAPISDEQFKFTLMSAIDEEGLKERLSVMMEDITMQGVSARGS